MAQGKKSFVLYADYINIFEELTDEEAGQLAKHMFRYVTDQHPEAENRLIKIAFGPIKQQLKRDLKEWEETIEKRKKAGLASAERRQQNTLNSTHVNTCQQVSTVNVNDNVNVNVNVTDTVLSKDNDKTKPPVVVKTWKTDFEIYRSGLNEVYNELIFDSEFIATQEKLNPNVDIQLSLEKSVLNFWSTEAGWKHKKKSRSKELDWKSTLTNSISQTFNKVYKQNQRNGKTSINNGNNKSAKDYSILE